jgi:DNA-binding CsgD family transcriptional regulator
VLPEARLLKLVGRIYDAAADNDLWRAALEDVASALDGPLVALIHYDLPAPRAQWGADIGADPEYAHRYVEYYSSINPWIARAARLNVQGVESITTSEQLLAFAELKKTEFYNDYASRAGSVHQIGGIISRSNSWCSAITCCRPLNTEPFGPDEIALLGTLLPHLQRAMQFHRKVAELEGCYRASLGALDRLPTGVILMDSRSRILEANRAAKLILSQNDGLRTDRDGLAASTSGQTKELRSGIAAAALTARGKGLSAGGSLGIVRPSGKRPLAVVITPVSAHAFAADARKPAVMVFVSDPETKVRTAPEVLARAYDLTAAESRLAEQLIQGETLVHAAERLGVSHNTARTHLQRIYEKTGTCHQGDLVRVLLAGITNLLPDKLD